MQFVKLAFFLPSAHEHSAWCSSGKGAWASNAFRQGATSWQTERVAANLMSWRHS